MKYDEEYYLFLDGLRESGITNMFGAAPYLMEIYPKLSRGEAKNILTDWMETFGERHKE